MAVDFGSLWGRMKGRFPALITLLLLAVPFLSAARGALLCFPEKQNVGKLFVLSRQWDPVHGSADGIPYGEARGRVVQPDMPLYLLANDIVAGNMQIFRHMPADALTCIVFSGCGVGGGQLAEISGLTGLRRLELSDTEINDAGLANLRSLKNLQYLNISFCGLNGTGLASLAGLKELRRLDLSSDHLDATVYERIAGFTDLEILVLSRCCLTDAALRAFSRLKGLRELIISSNSDVTDSGDRKSTRLNSSH